MLKRILLICLTAALVFSLSSCTALVWKFKSGQTAPIGSFYEINVDSYNGMVKVASADISNDYKAGKFKSSLDIGSFKNAKFPDSLDAISTENGIFYAVDYDASNDVWISRAAEPDEGYIEFAFLLKSKYDTQVELSANMKGFPWKSIKIGFSSFDMSGEQFEIYDFIPDYNDPYRPLVTEGAEIIKNSDGYFVPGADDYGFGEMREQREPWDIPVELSANEPKLLVVKIWNEGMDKDCSGIFSLESTGPAFILDISVN